MSTYDSELGRLRVRLDISEKARADLAAGFLAALHLDQHWRSCRRCTRAALEGSGDFCRPQRGRLVDIAAARSRLSGEQAAEFDRSSDRILSAIRDVLAGHRPKGGNE